MQILDPAFDPSCIRLIVYDLDGTLVDAFEDIWLAVKFVIECDFFTGHTIDVDGGVTL